MCDCPSGGPSWCEIVTVAFGVIAGAFALWQWHRQCRVIGAEHLSGVLQRFNEQVITETFYELINNVTYGGAGCRCFYTDRLKFAKGVEPKIDSMLLLFSEICHNRHIGVFRDSEFRYFSFQIRRTLAHCQIKAYLYDFAMHCAEHKIGCPYYDLIIEGLSVDRSYYRDLCANAGIHDKWYTNLKGMIWEAVS